MHKLSIYFLLSLVLLTQACAQIQESADTTTTTTTNETTPQVTGIKTLETVENFNEKLAKDSNAVIIDVRTGGEFASGHLEGARNIDFYAENFLTLCQEIDTKKPIYVYCKSGGRSAAATEKLKNAGFTVIYELKGGIMSWKAANMPIALN